MRQTLKWLIAGAGFFAAALASPEGAEAGSTPVYRKTSFGLDFRWWNSEDGGAVFPLVPFAHYEVKPGLFVDLELAFAPQSGGRNFSGTTYYDPFNPEADEGISRFGLGNPMLGAHYSTGDKNSSASGFFGLRLGLPLASLGDLDSDRANDLASATYGHADFYRWVPELFPLVGTAGFEAHPKPGLWLRMPVDFMVLFPTSDRRVTKSGVVARFEIEGQSDVGWGGGGALQLVVSDGFRTRRDDIAQVAIEPYFIYDAEHFFLRFGVMTALDRPLGFGLSRGGVVSADMKIGGSL